jgi:hypothetical protein
MLSLIFTALLGFAAETVLIDGKVPEGATVRGDWRDTAPGVYLSRGAPGYMDVLVPDGPDLTDGVARATLTLGQNPHVTLLIRATHAGDPEALNAIGLTVRANRIQWERWDGGVSLPVAPAVASSSPLGGQTVHVEIRAEGDRLSGVVRDASGQSVIVASSIRDARWAWGRAAIRVQDDGRTALKRLTVSGAPLEPGAPRPPGDPTAPLGEDRFALVPAADLAKLPLGLRNRVLGRWPYDTRDLRGLRLTPAELEQLQATGARVQVHPLVPFWALDGDVRAAAGQVRWVDGKPDLQASYKDPDMIAAIVRGWEAAHPSFARAFAIGRSHQGRDIVALRLTNHPRPDELPAVMILAGIHGSELLAPEYALDFVAELLDDAPRLERTLRSVDLWIVPLLNPDGNAITHTMTQYAGRKNGRGAVVDGRVDPFEGVDLNRNFPFGWGRDEQASRSFPRSMYYRGPEPGSEPETQALMRLVDQRRFVAAISFHTNGSMILVPYTLNGVTNPEPNAAWAIAERITAGVPEQPSGKPLRVRRQMYPVDGTEQDWMRHAHGTVAYTVEGSHHNPTNRSIRLASVRALRPLVPALIDAVIDGPRVSGRVVDRAGNPIEAVVTLSSERWTAGEAWSSRAADGRFHRLLGAAGPVQVTARAPGYRAATARVDAKGPVEVTLVMDRSP